MDDELEVLEKLGIANSPTIHSFLDKSYFSIIGCLNTLERYGEIKIVVLHHYKGNKKLYMKDEIYRDYFDEEG